MPKLVVVHEGAVRIMAVIAACLIVFLMVMISIDVVARYFFNAPSAWVFEVTEFTLLYIPFLGMAWLVRRADGGHVRIDIVIAALSPKAQAFFNCLAAFLAAIPCGLIGYYAFGATIALYQRDAATNGLYPMPLYLLVVVIVVGLLMTMIEFVRKGRQHYKEWQDLQGG